MTGSRIRRAAASAALACTLALAAPAHAAPRQALAVGSGWLDQALQWVTRLWTGDREPAGQTPAAEKCGMGTDPNGCPQAVTPPSTEKCSSATDPNGCPK